jgi:CRP-like cAMP-binding protein
VPREYLNDNRACSRPVFPALLRKFLESSFRTEFFPNGTRLPHCCPAGRPDGYQASDLGPGFSDQGFRAELSHPENWQTVPQDKTIEPRQVISSKLAVLRAHPIFCDLDADAFEQLGRYAKPATLKRGATIFSKGDPGNSLIAVVSGTVKISISSPDGRSAILNLIGPGEIFGEVAVLDGQARTADATANSNCEIVVIDRREFLPFVRSQPSLAMKFIERKATKDGRTIAVTQQEISEMVGMSRESINKQLRAWSMRNWVRLEHGAIVVLDLGPLQEIAGTALEDD